MMVLSLQNQHTILLVVAVALLALNVVMMNRQYQASKDPSQRIGANVAGVKIDAQFFSSHKVTEETKERKKLPPQSLATQQQHSRLEQHGAHTARKAKTLIGIISSDTFNDAAYRKRHRALFQIWKDPRTCTLHDYTNAYDADPQSKLVQDCQVIYTFIIGGHPDKENGPPELYENTTETPITLTKPIAHAKFQDVNDNDVTLLNIRENMNDGKSPTFLYYASLVMEHYDIEYAMKLDADSILHLHDFLLFVDTHLPPFPYATNMFIGALRNKAGWPPNPDPSQLPRLESFWGNEFEGVHLYLAGQCYIASLDLCKFVAQESPFSKIRVAKGGYLEGHEDHDVSAMIWHNPSPIHMVTIGKSQRFWEHPVKGQPRWERIQKREQARMDRTNFEGKILRLY